MVAVPALTAVIVAVFPLEFNLTASLGSLVMLQFTVYSFASVGSTVAVSCNSPPGASVAGLDMPP